MGVTLNDIFSRRAKILMVDDDSFFRSEFASYFSDYGVQEASNGEEAFIRLRRPNEIDLVFLDVRMSGINGIELLNRIRKLYPQLHVIILTAYGSKDIAVEALRAQADNYLEKPLDVGATRQLIETYLGTKRGQAGFEAINIKDKIERVKNFLQRNSLKKVTLKDAAEAVFLNPKYLSRVFKEHAGEGFKEYKLSFKMGDAKDLLVKTNYTVAQISDKLGYQNPESFIRQFKKVTAKTPTEFRKKQRP